MFSLSEGNIIMGYWCRIIYDCQVITSNQIWANNTFQYIFKSRWSTLTISLGEYFYDIPFPEVSAFNHNIKKYNRYIVIWYVRKQYDNMVMIHLYHSWTVLIVLSNSTICSCTDLMLTSALLNLSSHLFEIQIHQYCKFNKSISSIQLDCFLYDFTKVIFYPTWYMFDGYKFVFFAGVIINVVSVHKQKIYHEFQKFV